MRKGIFILFTFWMLGICWSCGTPRSSYRASNSISAESEQVVKSTPDTIHLFNQSFEQIPQVGIYNSKIRSWSDCGAFHFPEESGPDIHPSKDAWWGVNKPPANGRTYLGLVTRDNMSFESIGQELTLPLQSDQCYTMSVQLSQSETYLSGSRNRENGVMVEYTSPTILKIYGGNEMCSVSNLLYTSPPISHKEWKTYEISFKTPSAIEFLYLAAFYGEPNGKPTNGHILVDDLSHIKRIDCPIN